MSEPFDAPVRSLGVVALLRLQKAYKFRRIKRTDGKVVLFISAAFMADH
jgi:hypothetical protein